MPAPSSPPLAPVASTTSSGHADGLGRRALAFDREEGTMLERLTVRPELAAFERMLRERVERVAALEDERVARPRTVERDADGSLVVVSEFVPGCRLSDLLEACAESGTAPGVDVAFGYLLDVLPALCGLHAGAGFAHGTIAPCRTVLTPAGQVVLLDAVYGEALAHLRYGRRRLWTDFEVATPPSAGAPRLGVASDVSQVALSAVMLVLGRPLRPEDYPQGLSNLVLEVVDVAQIRGDAAFADRLLAFLQRALPVPGGRNYTTADDALIDLRELASGIGLQVCRRALVDCITQMEPMGRPADLASAAASASLAASVPDTSADSSPGHAAPAADVTVEPDLETGVDAEIDIEALVDESPYALEDVTEIEVSSEESSFYESLAFPWPDEPSEQIVPGGQHAGAAATPALPPPLPDPPARAIEPALPSPLAEAAAGTAGVPGHPPREEADAAGSSVRVQRAKRIRTARSRKDKLRSAAGPPAPGKPAKRAEPRAVPLAEPANDSWLVAPGRAAAFEPPVPLAPPMAPPLPAPAQAAPAVEAAPYHPPPPRPVFPPSLPVSAPSLPAAGPWQPGAASPDPLFSHPAVVAAHNAPLKFKEPEKKRAGTRAPAVEPEPVYEPVPSGSGRRPGTFSWKLGAAALTLMVMGVAGRSYLPGVTRPGAATPAAATAPAAVEPTATGAVAAKQGRLEIETQPAGANVLLDGKPVGQSPLTLDEVTAGRHTITFVTPSGTVKRTVRVEAGRTATLDVPIFSGWVGIYAPFVVDVAEGGRVIGTTDDPRLMLSPGRHVLTLTNRDLGYRSVETVNIEPGEVRSVSLDPQGSASLNATPWAEVWMDGGKLGDTPIANLTLPLGIRELTFRHPGLGERRVTVTIRGDVPATVSVDMTKP